MSKRSQQVKKKNKTKHKTKHNKLEASQPATLFTVIEPNSPISEQFRTIRTNIMHANFDVRTKSMAITSAAPSEGKSTTAANLAVMFAKLGMKTLLVDADMRRPTAHMTFELNNTMGLSNILSVKQLSVGEVVQESNIPYLDVITSGVKAPNPSELLASSRMKKLINVLENLYDFVVFDMPPASTVTDVQLVAGELDGVAIVVRNNVTDKKQLKRTIELLEKVDANIMGCIYFAENDSSYTDYYYN